MLYTDGLVERRDAALDEGLDRLATVATVLRDAPLPEFVDGLLSGLADHDGAADDIAVVAGRLLAAPLHLELPAAPAQLRALRRSLQQWTAEAGIGADVADDLQLAVGEAVANAVEHAYGDRWNPGLAVLDIRPESAGTLEVTVADSGAWRPVPADPGFRGRGLQIIRIPGHRRRAEPRRRRHHATVPHGRRLAPGDEPVVGRGRPPNRRRGWPTSGRRSWSPPSVTDAGASNSAATSTWPVCPPSVNRCWLRWPTPHR